MIDLALDNRIIIQSDLDLALQEIDMLMSTETTELLANPGYGVSLETFLWTLTPTTSELEKYIQDKIDTHTTYTKKFKTSVHATFYNGNYRSVYLVQITLTLPNGTTATRKYQYQ